MRQPVLGPAEGFEMNSIESAFCLSAAFVFFIVWPFIVGKVAKWLGKRLI